MTIKNLGARALIGGMIVGAATLIAAPVVYAAESVSSSVVHAMGGWVYVNTYPSLGMCVSDGKAEVNQNGALGYRCEKPSWYYDLWVLRP